MKRPLFILLLLATITVDACGQVVQVGFREWDHFCEFRCESGMFVAVTPADTRKITNCPLLPSDLDRYTIIGVTGMAGGCAPPVIEFVITRNDAERLYSVTAVIHTSGPCRKGWGYRRVICTDKFLPGYRIEYEKRSVADGAN